MAIKNVRLFKKLYEALFCFCCTVFVNVMYPLTYCRVVSARGKVIMLSDNGTKKLSSEVKSYLL